MVLRWNKFWALFVHLQPGIIYQAILYLCCFQLMNIKASLTDFPSPHSLVLFDKRMKKQMQCSLFSLFCVGCMSVDNTQCYMCNSTFVFHARFDLRVQGSLVSNGLSLSWWSCFDFCNRTEDAYFWHKTNLDLYECCSRVSDFLTATKDRSVCFCV